MSQRLPQQTQRTGSRDLDAKPVASDVGLAVETVGDACTQLLVLALGVRIEMCQVEVVDAAVGEGLAELACRRVAVHVDRIGKRTVVGDDATALGEAGQSLERLCIARKHEFGVGLGVGREPVGKPIHRVACLAAFDAEPADGDALVGDDLADPEIDPAVEIVVNREQVIEQGLRSEWADDFEVVLAGEPPGLEQRQQVGDVIEMEMCEQDGAHGLVANVR